MSKPLQKNAQTPDAAMKLPAMDRRSQMFSMAVFFLIGVGLTWFVVTNPLGLSWLPAASQPEPVTPAQTAMFQCPMHPEVLEDKPGTCPICFMDLVEIAPTRTPASAEPVAEATSYICPMHPQVIEAEPSQCPICHMDLVARKPTISGTQATHDHTTGHEQHEPGVIQIDPVQVQNIGVLSALATREDIARASRTVGILDFNADRITWINTKFEGWIETAHVNYVGQEVQPGEPLFEIYSPELVTTQEEYLRALDYRASLANSERAETQRQADSLVQSTRDRLKHWDVPDAEIARLEQSREVKRLVTVRAPTGGLIAEVMSEALEGMFVKPGMNLYKIADLSTIWVHADVYERDMPWIREGQPAAVKFRNQPDRTFHGKVLFLYPEVSRETRTLKICVEVPNRDQRLRPGMFADVVVQGPPVRNAVVVPQSAVIRSGERNIVFVDLDQGRFQPREVSLGITGDGDRIQVLDGIDPGESVVIQAQFMLDSESRIQEAIAKFRQRPASVGH